MFICKRQSLLDKADFGPFRLLVGRVAEVLFGRERLDEVFVDISAVLQLPDLAVTHDIDDFELAYEIVYEELDSFHAELILELFHIRGLVNDFHDILRPFFVVDPVDAGLGESFGELLHDMIASLHDLGSWERLHFQEGVACVLLIVPEFILILSMMTSYLLLS